MLLVAPIFFITLSSSAHADVTQTISFNQILPFGTYTDGLFVASDWTENGNTVAFPFNNPNQISNIFIRFDSTDAFYQAEAGPNPPPGGQPPNTFPLGGLPEVEINVLSPGRVGIVSLTKSSPQANLFDLADPQNRFQITRELLTDFANAGANPGNLGVRLGGFVGFFDNDTQQPVSSDDFTFGPTNTFTVTVTGVPEPGSVAIFAIGAVGMLRRWKR